MSYKKILMTYENGLKEKIMTYENGLKEKIMLHDFDVVIYKHLNIDLQHMTDKEAMRHYKNYGFYEERKYKISLPSDFDVIIYKQLNYDLQHMSDKEAMHHYITHGIKEGRKYKIVASIDFNVTDYKQLNEDLRNMSDEEAYNHYNNYGFYENRNFQTNITFNIDNDNSLNHFLQNYNVSENEMRSNPKIEFRYECLKNIPYIKNIILPEIQQNSYYEAVLIEYRCFPHLEFLIRNTINKLGDKWSHTIICGILNYDYMIDMCNKISSQIKIIKTEFENLDQNTYSKMLSSNYFWDYFVGEKILIYQEDSIIFKNNINDFLHFDYIGAPWHEHQNDNKAGVGNGGMSLRSKSVMKKIIETISIGDTVYNSSTMDYVTNCKLNVFPEDVYFTKNMEDYNFGLLADRNTASLFSTECILNKDSFAGHNFWLFDSNWKQRIYDNVVINFKPNYATLSDFYQHRGGWKSVLTELINSNFFSNNSNITFFDMMENQFLFNNNIICNNKWAGIIHCTPITPSYLDSVNISKIFENNNFIKSLDSCLCIFTLSNYLSKYIINKFKERNINVKVFTLTHPVDTSNIILFDVNKYINNNEKKILQIGQQLRKISSIYLLKNTNNHKKLWLTGNKNFNKCNYLLNKEIEYFDIDIENIDNNVTMHYTNNFEEYDELLSENIVFVDFFDAAANNTVLECIIRNTPIIVNKLEGVVDYLGEDYPLYFTNLDDVPEMLSNIDKIISAHQYLLNLDKNKITFSYFTKNIITCLNKVIDEKYNELEEKQIIYHDNNIYNENYKKFINALNIKSNINENTLYNFISSNKKLIGIYSPYDYSLGGGENYIAKIMNYFIEKDYFIIFFNFTEAPKSKKILTYYLNNNSKYVFSVSDKFIKDVNFINKIDKMLDYFIIMNNYSLPNIKGIGKINIYHCQFPFDYNNDNHFIQELIKNSTINFYNTIIVNSEFTYKHLTYLYDKYNMQYNVDKMKVLYPVCIDTVNTYKYEKQNYSFVMIGRIFDYLIDANNKHFDKMIKILNEFKDYNYELNIIGSVKSETWYNYLIQLIGDNNKIKIHRDISEDEKNIIIQKSKYFVQLTGFEENKISNEEHFGIAIIEGINYNCIPISYNGGYPPYYIKNNENGYVINNYEELKNLVCNILNNNEIVDSNNFNNNEFNLNKFTYDSFMKTIDNII